MKKSEFEEIQERYFGGRMRLEQISRGDLVSDAVDRDFYHPAIIKSVNLDEDYVSVIDIFQGNKERRLPSFLTASEMLKKGFTKEIIDKEYKKYSGIRKKVLEGKL